MNNIAPLLGFLDYTNLETDLSPIALSEFLKKASTANYHVAAVCVAPAYIHQAKEHLSHTPVKIASVFNFPYGTDGLVDIQDSIRYAIKEGVDECDLVIPFNLLKNASTPTQYKTIIGDFVEEVRSCCIQHVLKVIISTDVLMQPELIQAASEAVIEGGANFIKTCTGKTGAGVTPKAVSTILNVIKTSKRPIGIKVSGGIKTLAAATDYYQQVQAIYKDKPLSPSQFRIGASQLLEEILKSTSPN